MASARPRRASKCLNCRLWKHGTSFSNRTEGKECHNQDKQAQGASFGGSFLVPEIDMIFGDGVGASLVVVMVVVAVVVVAVVAVGSSSSSSSSCSC